MQTPPAKSSKDVLDCHLSIRNAWPTIVKAFETEYKAPGLLLFPDYSYRTPADQFEIFKHGRELQNGIWVLVNPKLKRTDKDGTLKPSHHNVYPAQALDFNIRKDGGKTIIWPNPENPDVCSLYRYIGELWDKAGLIGGATWKYSWRDWSHVQVAYEIV